MPDVRSGFRGLQQLWRYAQYRQHHATRGTGLKRAAPHATADCADRPGGVDPADIVLSGRERHDAAGGDVNDECHR